MPKLHGKFMPSKPNLPVSPVFCANLWHGGEPAQGRRRTHPQIIPHKKGSLKARYLKTRACAYLTGLAAEAMARQRTIRVNNQLKVNQPKVAVWHPAREYGADKRSHKAE